MKIKQFIVNPLQENTYLIWGEKDDSAAIIDPGMMTEEEERKVESFIEQHRLSLKLSLQTHGHSDHIAGVPFIYEKYGLNPWCHAKEETTYYAAPEMFLSFGIFWNKHLPTLQYITTETQSWTLGTLQISSIFTPGHTPGGICFWIPSEKVLFTGDTLFFESIGRSVLPGGNFGDEIRSLKRLFSLCPLDTVVYPGHGGSTSIGWEIEHNPYF